MNKRIDCGMINRMLNSDIFLTNLLFSMKIDKKINRIGDKAIFIDEIRLRREREKTVRAEETLFSKFEISNTTRDGVDEDVGSFKTIFDNGVVMINRGTMRTRERSIREGCIKNSGVNTASKFFAGKVFIKNKIFLFQIKGTKYRISNGHRQISFLVVLVD